jgi:hypothetical protein
MSKRRTLPIFVASLLLLPCMAVVSYGQAKSPLSAGAARNLIRRVAGGELPASAVRVRQLFSPDRSTVDALTQVETAFRLLKEPAGWRIVEVRTGDNRWEETGLILSALEVEAAAGSVCAAGAAEGAEAGGVESDPNVREVRCLLAQLFGVQLPSDAIRVKSISPLALGNAPSAVVEAQVDLAFRLVRGTDRKWRVTKMGTGGNQWADVEAIVAGINERKRARALEELNALAAALEAFRSERGFYVAAKTESALVDQLNPRYLPRVIRIDPWRKPYQYEGTRDVYVLRSNGADGQPNTADDVVVKKG